MKLIRVPITPNDAMFRGRPVPYTPGSTVAPVPQSAPGSTIPAPVPESAPDAPDAPPIEPEGERE